VLVTDLKMPGINGLTLAAAARSLQPAIGVILMTAYGSREIEAEAEQLMVDAYLTKPFQLERLRDLIEKILHAQLYSDTNNIIGAEHAGTQPQNRSAMEVE
jgi:DNA-binding NtrC family response regulator